MKRIILACVVLAFACSCSDAPPPTIPSIVINNTATNNNGQGSENQGGIAAGCLPSEEIPIRVDLSMPDGSVAVGSSAPIDSTPKGSTGKRSDQCNVQQGIAWSAVPSTVCYVKSPSDFNTAVVCTAAGSCQLTASVPGKGAYGTSTVSCK